MSGLFRCPGLRLLWGGDRLLYAARTRNGSRRLTELMHQRVPGAGEAKCAFANLPEARAGQESEGLTGGEDGGLPVAGARPGGPVRVCGMEAGQHLRHSRFVGLRATETKYP